MEFEEFSRRLKVILEPDTPDAEVESKQKRKTPTRCPDCGSDREITIRDSDAVHLIARYINFDSGHHSKSGLLGCLERINRACDVVPTRGILSEELIGQASRTLSSLVEQCASFEGFRQILEKCDYRLLSAGSNCRVTVDSLLNLGKRS